MLSACSNYPFTSLVDPKILEIPIQNSDESLVDLRDQSIIQFGPSPEIPNNYDYTKIRKSVYDKLVVAQKSLPHDLKFCLYEGYRSLGLQGTLFEDRYSLLKQKHPHWDHVQLFHETAKLVSPVINLNGSHNIPPHSTGAAIDIYLINNHQQIVDMGIKVEDWMQDVDGSLSKTHSAKISGLAQHHREIMSSALIKIGFVNYPGEYWHWSYGDRYWAYHVGEKKALYGTVE